jgi:flagellar protein FliO/FliZ
VDAVFVGLRVVLSLGVVLALLYVLQKRIVKGGRSGRQTSQVTVVARQGIGAKASVVVVDVEGERLVLGVTDASVTVLAASDRP